MSHYITVPLNENGVITDQYIQEELKVVCTQRFGITDVFLYSHGWWTNAVSAMAEYNRFSVNFADKTLDDGSGRATAAATTSHHQSLWGRPALALNVERR